MIIYILYSIISKIISDDFVFIQIYDERILIVAVIDSSIVLLCVSLPLLFGQGLFIFLCLSCDFKDYFRPSPLLATSLRSAGWS